MKLSKQNCTPAHAALRAHVRSQLCTTQLGRTENWSIGVMTEAVPLTGSLRRRKCSTSKHVPQFVTHATVCYAIFKKIHSSSESCSLQYNNKHAESAKPTSSQSETSCYFSVKVVDKCQVCTDAERGFQIKSEIIMQ